MSEVIGVDLSLASTGLATATELRTLKSAPGDQSIPDRLTRLALIVRAVAVSCDAGDLAMIEGPSFGQQRQGGEHMRAGLWWLVADTLTSRDVQLVEVPPASLKKYATGKGNATKADMRMALFRRAGLDVRDDNQVDAYWLRDMGLRILGQPSVDLPAGHLVALEKVRVPL